MSKKADFVKSIHGMNEQDLTARLEEDKQDRRPDDTRGQQEIEEAVALRASGAIC